MWRWENRIYLDGKSIIMGVMQPSVLLALLTVAILVAAPLQAQRAGGGSHGGGPGMPVAMGWLWVADPVFRTAPFRTTAVFATTDWVLLPGTTSIGTRGSLLSSILHQS